MGLAKQVVLCGLDGATFKILQPMMDQGLLPNLTKALAEGASGGCDSTFPPVTAPAWTTCVTGVNPGKHGVFGFFARDKVTLEPRYVSSSAIRVPTVWRLLSDAGRKVNVVNVPITYPPEKVNGNMITGFLTPKGRSFAYPETLREELEAQGYRINSPAPSKGHIQIEAGLGWLADLHDVSRRRTETVLKLNRRNRPDFTMVVYMTPDVIQHHYYKYLDPREKLYDSAEAETLRPALHKCYQALDDAFGEYRESLGKDGLVMAVSDHGFAALEGRLYLNRWLAQEGYLKVRKASLARYEITRTARTRLARKFKKLNAVWGGPVAYKDSFMDLANSKALGGEPIEYAVYKLAEDAPLKEIAVKLLALKDPISGDSLVEEVIPREEVYQGRWVENAPDLILRMNDDRFGLANRLWSRKPGIFRPMRGPSGMHAREGIVILAGDTVQQGKVHCGLQDITPTVLYALGEPIPSEMDGRALTEAFRPEVTKLFRPQVVQQAMQVTGDTEDAYSTEDSEEVSRRLAELGYID